VSTFDVHTGVAYSRPCPLRLAACLLLHVFALQLILPVGSTFHALAGITCSSIIERFGDIYGCCLFASPLLIDKLAL
jgi:hypothetical protein